MRYLALAADYDGTLARHGAVDEPTVQALERLRASGRRLVLVTGRELDQLREVFPKLELFDRVVAENGAVLLDPVGRYERPLAERPPDAFVEALRARGVGPISVGRVIVATWEPHQAAVLEAIHELGLELHVIFNKGAVMVLPSGVNKATGLSSALDELGVSPHNCVGIGDAENDHAFLALCECSAAVANALDAVKRRCDFVAHGGHGEGVVELIEMLLADDLRELEPKLGRHAILLGTREDRREERVEPYGVNVLVAGTSGSGKSSMTTGFLERLADPGYQYVIIDPEGDYSSLDGAVVLGDPHHAPTVEELLGLLGAPRQEVVANLLGISLDHRPAFFQGLLPQLQEKRARSGRPHWVVVDEAHHLMPASWDPATLTLPQELRGMLLITVHPNSIAPAVLKSVDLVLAVGEAPERTIGDFCRAVGEGPPRLRPTRLEKGETLAWWRTRGTEPAKVRSTPGRSEQSRHSRKYAEGNLGPERSFQFRGPEGKLHLRAQNLVIFLQMADGVDDDTWMFHLRRQDYSKWFREGVKDDSLACEAERIETAQRDAPAAESRRAIRQAIERRYTLPSEQPSGEISPAGPAASR
jgi:HAD superfamily hydrolase (TIGR01484 family)